jgi:hypothetical protein
MKPMNDEYKQSKEDLEQHLKDIIEALQLSSKAFDEGHEGESKRLAAAIRVLVHDTESSKSLLGQLGLKNMQFYDTSSPRPSNKVMTYHGLIAIELTPQESKYKALFDELPPDTPPRWISFEEWWNKVIFVDNKWSETTRKGLICAVANKDGGAHVDPVLDKKYADLSRHNSLAWRFSSPKGDFPLEGPEKATIRQITHEMLKSLDPKMPRMKPNIHGTLFFGASTKVEQKQSLIPKVGPNVFCPCGSGKKYKRCHGKLSAGV